MSRPQEPLETWMVTYISQLQLSKSRYEIDSHLINAGYDPVELETAWSQLQEWKAEQIAEIKSKKLVKFLRRVLLVLFVIDALGLIWLSIILNPPIDYYFDPDNMVNQATVGQLIGIPPGFGYFLDREKIILDFRSKGLVFYSATRPSTTIGYNPLWVCRVKSSNLAECVWQSAENPDNIVVIRIFKSKSITSTYEDYWKVRIVDKQGSTLICDFEGAVNSIS